MARFAELVVLLGAAVEDLKLGEHEDHRTERTRGRRSALEHLVWHTQRHVDHEVHDRVVLSGEAVVEPRQVVFDLELDLKVGHQLRQMRVRFAVVAEIEERVRRLPRDHVVEREDVPKHVVERREDVVTPARHDPEAELVVDVRRDGVRLRQELLVERVLVLAPADELEDREAVPEHAADDAIDLLLDQIKELLIGERQHELQLAPFEVMDDVHHLQDRARAHLPVALARREHQQADHVERRDRLGHREVEVPPQERDRLVTYGREPRRVARIVQVELLSRDELPRFVLGAEVEAVPVDDGTAAQEQP